MNYQPLNPGGGGFDVFASLVVLVGLLSAVFWMVVGWRAMRAHEQLAKSARDLAARRERSGDSHQPDDR